MADTLIYTTSGKLYWSPRKRPLLQKGSLKVEASRPKARCHPASIRGHKRASRRALTRCFEGGSTHFRRGGRHRFPEACVHRSGSGRSHPNLTVKGAGSADLPKVVGYGRDYTLRLRRAVAAPPDAVAVANP